MAQCTATVHRTGERCKRAAIKGGTVCIMHGGAAPQVKRKAAERIAEVRDDALELLRLEIKRGGVDAKVALDAVRHLTELTETLEGRVARREEMQVDDIAGSRERLAQQLAGIAQRRSPPGDPEGDD